MRLPSELYIRYLIYTSKTPDEVVALLRDKLLIKSLAPSEITLRQGRFMQYLNELVLTNIPPDEVLTKSGIKELVDYFTAISNGFPADADVTAAFGIITYLPIRKIIERAMICNANFDEVADFLLREHGTKFSIRTLELYSKYFYNRGLTRYEWYTYLMEHDTFGYLSLFDNSEEERIFKSQLAFTSYDRSEYDLVARKSFEMLRDKICDTNADPDTCSKWFKLFEASRAKSNIPYLIGGTAGDKKDKFELGIPEKKDYKLKNIEDFVLVKKDDDPTAKSK